MSLIPFCLLNVTTWKLEIAYVTCTIFLLESTGDILKHMDIHIHILHMDFIHICVYTFMCAMFSWLKTQLQKMKIMASGPITSWQIDGKQW